MRSASLIVSGNALLVSLIAGNPAGADPWAPIDESKAVRTLVPPVGEPNPVIAWNIAARDAVALARAFPPPASRVYAMTHIAIFEAVNSAEPRWHPYEALIEGHRGADPTAAVATAGQGVLATLFPQFAGPFAALRDAQLADVADGPAKDSGIAVGQKAATRIIQLRTGDGSAAVVSYVPKDQAGFWRPTWPSFRPGLVPQWATVVPFAMPDNPPFYPPPPPALGTVEYAADVNEVRLLGEYFDSQRTEEQTGIALFWADETGTSTPPGHWNRIASTVARDRGLDIAETARTLALMNIAVADASILCWHAKYHHEYWRPITAIALADSDGNPATAPDDDWTPRLVTPPFPEYPSGHSTFSGAADAVLSELFGHSTSFVDTSEGLPINHGVPDFERTFSSFAEAADEAGRSRVYGGIHFTSASREGKASGRALGLHVVRTRLTPLVGDGWELR